MSFHQSFLLEQLSIRKQRNPRYSLRAFARTLEVSPAQLSSLISGRKNLTLKLATKIIDKLELDEIEARELLRGFVPEMLNSSTIPDQHLVSEDEFRLIGDWVHFAVLSLSRISSNKADPTWIADKLQIDYYKAKDVLFRLERLGHIVVKNGCFTQVSKPLVTTSDIPSSIIRSYHKQCLNLAADKIESVPVALREFSTITMAIDAKKLEKAKKMMNEFKHKLCQELETKDVTNVYTFSMQLFPLSL